MLILAAPISTRFSGASVAQQGLSVHSKQRQHSWHLDSMMPTLHLCPLLLLPWQWVVVRLQDLCCLTASAHISRVPPPKLGSPGKYLLPSKQSCSGKEAGGSGPAPSALFPINFSPVAFAEALIMMTSRTFLCVAASRGVMPPSLLSSKLPEDQRVS